MKQETKHSFEADMNNAELEKAFDEMADLQSYAIREKHIADGWPNSTYGDQARKNYEFATRRAKDIYRSIAAIHKLAQRYGDLPTELLSNLFAYDTTESRLRDLGEHRSELLRVIDGSHPTIKDLDERIYAVQSRLKDLEPKANKCLKMVEYMGLEFYDAFITYSGESWINRSTHCEIVSPFGDTWRDHELTESGVRIIEYQFQEYGFNKQYQSLAFNKSRNRVLVREKRQ